MVTDEPPASLATRRDELVEQVVERITRDHHHGGTLMLISVESIRHHIADAIREAQAVRPPPIVPPVTSTPNL